MIFTLLTELFQAVLAADAAASTNSWLSMGISLVVLIAVFYFMLIRPENKRKKEAAKMRSELAVGDVITTIGGVVGTICAVKEETIVIETGADRVRIEFTKWAISSKGTQTSEYADTPKTEKKSKEKDQDEGDKKD